MAVEDIVVTEDPTGDGSCTANMPTTSAGKTLVAIFLVDRDGQTVTPPVTHTWQVSVTCDLSGPDAQTFRSFWRIADGTEGATQKWTSSSTGRGVVMAIASLSGRAASSPINFATATPNTSANTSPISISAASGTAIAGDDILAFCMTDNTAPSEVWDFSTPSTFTSLFAVVNDDAWSFRAFKKENVSAGAFGSIATTATRSVGSNTAGWGAIVIAVKLAGGATTKVMSDSLTVTDAAPHATYRVRQMSDTTVVIDNVVQWRRLKRVMDEALTITDNVVKSLIMGGTVIYTKVMSDALSLTDGFFDWLRRVRAPIETVTLSDGDTYRFSIVTATEAFDVADDFVSWRRLVRVAQDNFSLIDGFSKTMGSAGIVYAKVVSDTVTLIDDAGQRWKLNVTRLTDSVGLSDQVIRSLRAVRALGDVVEFSDGVVKVRRTVKLVDDALVVSDGTVSTLYLDQISNVSFKFGSSGPPFRFGGM